MPCEWPESFFFCPANPAYMDGCACLSDHDSFEKHHFQYSHTAGGSAAAEGIRRKKPAAAGWYTEFVVQ